MLAVAPLRNTKDERDNGESFSIGDDFPDFSGDNLLDSIDFDDLFDGMEDDDDVLPALEIVDPDDNNIMRNTFVFEKNIADENNNSTSSQEEEEEDKVNSGSGFGSSGLTSSSLNNQGDEIVSKRDESVAPPKKADHKGRKSSKNNQGKRKVKVDWTPELHRRLVQAVEQLGVDKAVPSRILELMGIDCLTRRNIASHLQVPNSVTPGTPCFPPPTRFPAPPVRGIPPHAMYKVDPSPGVLSAPAGQTCPYPPSSDFHPSKESIDAAIGDVLSKPWLPRPLGLKPPSTDSVVVELHRRGIEKIPPTCA